VHKKTVTKPGATSTLPRTTFRGKQSLLYGTHWSKPPRPQGLLNTISLQGGHGIFRCKIPLVHVILRDQFAGRGSLGGPLRRQRKERKFTDKRHLFPDFNVPMVVMQDLGITGKVLNRRLRTSFAGRSGAFGWFHDGLSSARLSGPVERSDTEPTGDQGWGHFASPFFFSGC